MPEGKTDLFAYRNNWYNPGRSVFIRALWFVVNEMFFRTAFPFYGVKRILLRMFGAKIGKGLILKPHVSIKYPWKLQIADHVWIGEGVWLDNLGQIKIGNHACISQGAMLLCGNHNYKKSSFDLVVKDIHIEDGAWIGAKAIVCPGVKAGSHSLLTVGSVATFNLEPYWIYQGNPAQKVKLREIRP